MPEIMSELLIDFEAYREGVFKLHMTPRSDLMPESVEDWQTIYRGMVSYESALDEAGYETEAEMKAPDAPVLVHLCKISEDGSITYTDFRPNAVSGVRTKTVTAAEVFTAHELPLEFWVPTNDDTPQP